MGVDPAVAFGGGAALLAGEDLAEPAAPSPSSFTLSRLFCMGFGVCEGGGIDPGALAADSDGEG